MKTLCITGISEPDLVQVNARFCQAGMAETLSIEKNGRQLNMAQWHDRFCSAASLEKDASGPGKFGDQLAGELFFSNMETPFWGWADSRSTFLLDFWAAFDPRIVFVLTCCSLDHYLARLMETQDAASLNLDNLITSWQQFHTHLLQFYHTYPDRCLLVDIHDCATQFNILNQTCRDEWHLPLTDIPETELESEAYPFPAPLARHIAAGFTKNHPEAASLWHEIQATVSRSTSDPVQADSISFNHIAQNYQTTKDRSAELRQISDLEKQIATQKKEQTQKEARLKELEQKNQEVSEENDLILQQLHQLQKELESMFLKKQEAEQQWADEHKKLQTDLKDKEQQLKQREEQIATLQKQAQDSAGQLEEYKKNAGRKDSALKQVEQQLQEKSTQLQELEKQIAAQKKEQTQKEARLKELEQKNQEVSEENDLILLQLHQVQEELESMFFKKQKAEQQWADEHKKLQTDIKDKEQQLKQREEQIATLQKQSQESAAQLAQEKKIAAQKDTQFKELEQRNQEATEENDLILLQLHQVQEELKSIFLKKQEAEQQWAEKHKKILHENEQWLYQLHEVQEELGQYVVKYQEQNKLLEKAEARWARLLKRMPDYCNYGDIRIIQGDDASSLICEVRDLDAGAQTYPELEFETFIIKGVTGFRFKHTEYITQEDLIPVAQTPEEAKMRSSVLKNLTTTEWLLLESTAHFLKTCLKTEKFDEETLPAPLIQETLNGLERFNQVISKFPEILRYDAVSFDEKALSEDCEHLEIRLESLSCRDLVSPEFVFRLTCAGLSFSDFGSNPRLEFPEDTNTILKTWFDCSSNPDDPRLEIRFAPPEAMDLDVWNNLSKDDAGFIHMLTVHLPEMIEKSVSQSGHDESKWLAVAKDVGAILTRWANRL